MIPLIAKEHFFFYKKLSAIRCYYLSFWQFRYFLVDGAVSVSKERSFFLSHHFAYERSRVSKRARFFCPII